jgi:hypothetical protein
MHDLEVNPYQRVATKTNVDRHSLVQNQKGMLVNDSSAGEGSGIYNYPARHSICFNEITIVNCQGLNTNYS